MQVEYRRDNSHSYLILSGIDKIDTASYPVRMITVNKMENFLECRIHMMDQKPLFYFDITSRQSLKVQTEFQSIGYEMWKNLLESLLRAMGELDRYLLPCSGILLSPEMIYLSPDMKTIQFLYVPDTSQDFTEMFISLSEFLLPRIDHTDKKAVVLGYQMYRKAGEEPLSEKMIRDLLYGTEDTAVAPEKEEKNPVSVKQEKTDELEEQKMRETLLKKYLEEEQKECTHKHSGSNILTGAGICLLIVCIFCMKWVSMSTAGYVIVIGCMLLILLAGNLMYYRYKKGKCIDTDKRRQQKEQAVPVRMEERTERTWDEKTIVLTDHIPDTDVKLIPVSPATFPVLYLDEGMKLVGKLECAADLLIPSDTVSRIHARIQKVDGGWRIQDLNSKNGTYVNKRALMAEEWVELQNGDEICFADIIYRFQKKNN